MHEIHRYDVRRCIIRLQIPPVVAGNIFLHCAVNFYYYITCQLFREMFHIICTFGAVILYNCCNVRLLLVKISTEEFEKKDINGLIRYVARAKRKKPYTKSRNSNQTWLETDRNSVKTLQSLRQRYDSHNF